MSFAPSCGMARKEVFGAGLGSAPLGYQSLQVGCSSRLVLAEGRQEVGRRGRHQLKHCNKSQRQTPNSYLSFPTCEEGKWGVSLVLLSPSSSPILRGPQNLGCGVKGGRSAANSDSILLASCTYPTPR